MFDTFTKNNIQRNPHMLFEYLSSLNLDDKLLIVSSSFHIKNNIKKLKFFLDKKNVKYKLLFSIQSNPSYELLDQIKTEIYGFSFNHILAIGGGSVIDIAKILKILPFYSVESKTIQDKNINKLPFLIVVPTTIGTGAELTPFATIWDHKKNKKVSIEHYLIKPDMIINDVKYLNTLKEDHLLYPVLDALSHTLESIWNINSSNASKDFAFCLAERINNFIKLYIEKNFFSIDLKKMQIYSQIAGLLISKNKTAIAHSISYPLTLHKNVPHGLGVSFTLSRIINKYIKCSILTDKQIYILNEIKKSLHSLNLENKIYNYITKNDLINLIPEMKHPDRIKNFSISDYTIKEFIA